jgi:hypothetical protein
MAGVRGFERFFTRFDLTRVAPALFLLKEVNMKRAFQAFIFVGVCVRLATAGNSPISLDNSTTCTVSSAGATTCSVPFTVGAITQGYLLVGISNYYGPTKTENAVTWGPTNLALLANCNTSPNTAQANVWGVAGVMPGTNQLTVTFGFTAQDVAIRIASFAQVESTTPIDATPVCNVALGGPSSIAQSITTVTKPRLEWGPKDGALVVDFTTFSGASSTATPAAGQTQIGSTAAGTNNKNVSSYKSNTATGATTNTENFTGTSGAAEIAVIALRPTIKGGSVGGLRPDKPLKKRKRSGPDKR